MVAKINYRNTIALVSNVIESSNREIDPLWIHLVFPLNHDIENHLGSYLSGQHKGVTVVKKDFTVDSFNQDFFNGLTGAIFFEPGFEFSDDILRILRELNDGSVKIEGKVDWNGQVNVVTMSEKELPEKFQDRAISLISE